MADRWLSTPGSDSLPYRDLLDGDPDRGVVLFDADLRIVYANVAARAQTHDGDGARLAGLREAVSAFRSRLERSGGPPLPVEVPLGDAAGRPFRATIGALGREGARWFVVRISPPGQYAEPSVRRLQTRFQLTLREAQVAVDVALGYSNAEVASRHGITEKTVKNALMSVFAKCSVRNRVELALRAHDAPVGHRPLDTGAK